MNKHDYGDMTVACASAARNLLKSISQRILRFCEFYWARLRVGVGVFKLRVWLLINRTWRQLGMTARQGSVEAPNALPRSRSPWSAAIMPELCLADAYYAPLCIFMLFTSQWGFMMVLPENGIVDAGRGLWWLYPGHFSSMIEVMNVGYSESSRREISAGKEILPF